MRFPGFEGEWETKKLSAYLYENKERNRNGEFNKSDVLSVSGDCGIVNQIELLGRSFAGKSVADYHVVRTDDIVYTKSPLKEYPYGIVKYNNGKDGIVSTLYAVYHHKDNVDGQFVEYYFTNPQRTNRYFKPIVRIGAKHDMKIGNEEVLENFVIFPCLKEQKKITEMLSLLDQRIAIQNKVIEDLKRLKRAINNQFHDSVTCGIKTCFADLGNSYSGLSGKAASDFGEGYPFIPYTNVFSNTVIDENDYGLVNVSKDEHQNIVEHGDLIITLSSETPEEVGVGAVYMGHDKEIYLNSFCFGIHFHALDRVMPKYLAYMVESNMFRRFVYPLAQGSTRYNLQKGDFEKKLFTLPTLAEQSQIVAVLDTISSKLDLEKSILKNLTTVKASMIQGLFV